MKNKRIDLYVQRQKAKKQERSRVGGRTKVALAFLILLVAAAAFLLLDTNRMEKKTMEGNAVLNDPANLARYEEISSLNQREASYLSIKENLDGLNKIIDSYPDMNRDFFSHLMTGNAPGVVLSNFSYDAASGLFSMFVSAEGYAGWTQIISKLEESPYITGFEYAGYQRNLSQNIYSANYTFRLVKVTQVVDGAGGE
jgi:hypothetical protein